VRRPTAADESLLRTLDAVLRTSLLTTFDSQSIERTTNYVVSNTGKVTYTTTANQHDGVLLKVVAFTTNVGRDFPTVGKTHTCDLPQRGVRLLRGNGSHR
jgi:hypothetical protein